MFRDRLGAWLIGASSDYTTAESVALCEPKDTDVFFALRSPVGGTFSRPIDDSPPAAARLCAPPAALAIG